MGGSNSKPSPSHHKKIGGMFTIPSHGLVLPTWDPFRQVGSIERQSMEHWVFQEIAPGDGMGM